ncbi:unnamed protein product [Protopolystoma xenopodis]|uniref:Uncharacterized protein n=1 Tax=Protopolystoma xenopodis TaxID=117903 RepID=A0A3S5A6B6_9PLAT|nr:unnamed protein product [Protopolystoma xenopodis]
MGSCLDTYLRVSASSRLESSKTLGYQTSHSLRTSTLRRPNPAPAPLQLRLAVPWLVGLLQSLASVLFCRWPAPAAQLEAGRLCISANVNFLILRAAVAYGLPLAASLVLILVAAGQIGRRHWPSGYMVTHGFEEACLSTRCEAICLQNQKLEANSNPQVRPGFYLASFFRKKQVSKAYRRNTFDRKKNPKGINKIKADEVDAVAVRLASGVSWINGESGLLPHASVSSQIPDMQAGSTSISEFGLSGYGLLRDRNMVGA